MTRQALAVLLVLGLGAAPAGAVPSFERTCGTPLPTPAELQQSRLALTRALVEGRAVQNGGTIRIALHIITSKGEGNVSSDQIQEQIRELNRGYAGTGFRFVLDSVDRTDNPSWFKMAPGTGSEKQAKLALAIDPAHRLNLYTCRPGHDLLGWAYFPFSAPEDNPIHGVVVHYGSLPGGIFAAYSLGRTATHEIGHYLGLFHTFQGGCVAPGDEIDDTPFESSPAFGCQEGRNTCTQDGDDPIHNYMDYSDDPCLTEFTKDQTARMQTMVTAYRPSLFATSVAQASLSPVNAVPALRPVVEFRGAMPNPFQGSTVLRFALTRSEPVSLKIFNVAGQHVATLIDGRLPEGDHSALFRGDDLPAGMYFAALWAGNVKTTRSMMLVK
jgi:Pregnancy-associated plasma protein-A